MLLKLLAREWWYYAGWILILILFIITAGWKSVLPFAAAAFLWTCIGFSRED